ncbi:DUF1120 domain-containing protein [Herbaspirillum sp. alder98]|uniref:DUF1120 domain-containing protein n=1 Tax=Herbaspirillum sp. alder98 TaxID=2913096 RepID=UPI001CD8810A|nr:DUF1120 domain-containing protein [Herbaspirillum sp. alder98]MCA1325337.1 DUF1120 domain-containing protein [Herbaspirillum sp. alder98]
MKQASLIHTALVLAAAAATITVPGDALGASTHLQVHGVVRPAACTPALQGDGTIDYLDVGYRSLSQTEINRLPTREIELSITCTAPARVGIRTVDNRSASKVAFPSIIDQAAMYGLGTVGKTNIGAFRVAITKLQAGSVPLDLLVRGPQAGAIWTKSSTGTVRTDQTLSWGDANTVAVGSYQRITATLGVTPVLNRASLLPANEIINLDGSATIEMVYL